MLSERRVFPCRNPNDAIRPRKSIGDALLLLLGFGFGTRSAEQRYGGVWWTEHLLPVSQRARLQAQALGDLLQAKTQSCQPISNCQGVLPHLPFQGTALVRSAAAALP
jgi:hypothetical protein